MQRRDKEYVHGQLAVEAAKIQGIFPDIDTIWKVDLQEEDKVETAKEDVDTTIDKWQDSHLSLIVIRAWNPMIGPLLAQARLPPILAFISAIINNVAP